MAWYNSIGDLAGDIGGIAKAAAPIATVIPGVGPLVGAGLAAGGSVLSGLAGSGSGGSAGSAGGGALSTIGSAITNNANPLLAAASAAAGTAAQNKAGSYLQDAIGRVNSGYDAGKQLLEKGAPSPNLDGLYAPSARSNPYQPTNVHAMLSGLTSPLASAGTPTPSSAPSPAAPSAPPSGISVMPNADPSAQLFAQETGQTPGFTGRPATQGYLDDGSSSPTGTRTPAVLSGASSAIPARYFPNRAPDDPWYSPDSGLTDPFNPAAQRAGGMQP